MEGDALKRVVSAIAIILPIFTAACDRAEDARLKPPTLPAEIATVEAAAPKHDTPTERLYLAGIEDSTGARHFLEELKAAVTNDDRDALLGMVRYPFSTYQNGKRVRTYAKVSSLRPHFDRVFTDEVLHAIRNASYETLFVNSQGAMLGNGEVWFDGRSDGIKIKALNSTRSWASSNKRRPQ